MDSVNAKTELEDLQERHRELTLRLGILKDLRMALKEIHDLLRRSVEAADKAETKIRDFHVVFGHRADALLAPQDDGTNFTQRPISSITCHSKSLAMQMRTWSANRTRLRKNWTEFAADKLSSMSQLRLCKNAEPNEAAAPAQMLLGRLFSCFAVLG